MDNDTPFQLNSTKITRGNNNYTIEIINKINIIIIKYWKVMVIHLHPCCYYSAIKPWKISLIYFCSKHSHIFWIERIRFVTRGLPLTCFSERSNRIPFSESRSWASFNCLKRNPAARSFFAMSFVTPLFNCCFKCVNSLRVWKILLHTK